MLEASDLVLAGRLDGLSIRLRPGEVTAICGPNGAGKSSLLLALAGLLPPDRGVVMLDDHPMAALPVRERARAIGFLPQVPEVAWDVSVETLVSLGRLPWAGAPAGEDAQAVEQALATVSLAALRHRPVSRLSGGERARALVARVLAGRPRWLLADEPLASLDLAHAAALMDALRGQAARGTGVAVVLHDLATAMNRADRVVVLHQGRLLADGPPAEALSAAVLRAVWGVEASCLGDRGRMALSQTGPAR